MKLVSPDELVRELTARASGERLLVGIDGRPCAGKSTLVAALETRCTAQTVSLDAFVRPFRDGSPLPSPAFPFPYVRYDEFLDCIRALAAGREVEVSAYDFETDAISAIPITVRATGVILIEGVSALNEQTRNCLDLGVYVVSDAATRLEAIRTRDQGRFTRWWHELWLPSEALYHATSPWLRADLLVAGRNR